MRLVRSHGLGNDYLVLDEPAPLDAALVRAICDRHRGVGSDGILEPTPAHDADFGVRIWNPDGSIAEKSGNGLRIFARWLADHGAGAAFSVSTGACVVRCEVGGDAIAVEMGRALVGPAESLDLGSEVLRFVPVDVGNPHAVLFRDETPEDVAWAVRGPAIEHHPRFPNRTNVQYVTVRGSNRIDIQIWERGAGETQASGSSSCAAAAAAVFTGRIQVGLVKVGMPGGFLDVEVSSDLELVLRGPVEVVGVVELDPRWLGARLYGKGG